MSQELKRDPAPGELVWLKPASVPVCFETRLRGGVLSGQRGNRFPPDKNKVLNTHRVKKLTEPTQVVWDTWWQRRFNQGEVVFCAPPKPEAKKSGGDK